MFVLYAITEGYVRRFIVQLHYNYGNKTLMTFTRTIRPAWLLILPIALIISGCSSKPQHHCAADSDCAPAPPGRAALLDQARQHTVVTTAASASAGPDPDLTARIRAAQVRFANQSRPVLPAASPPPEPAPLTDQETKPAAISPAPSADTSINTSATTTEMKNPGYTIQIGSFKQRENRIKLIRRFPDDAPCISFGQQTCSPSPMDTFRQRSQQRNKPVAYAFKAMKTCISDLCL